MIRAAVAVVGIGGLAAIALRRRGVDVLPFAADVPELADLLAGAGHVDVKTVDSDRSLRQLVAAAIDWWPSWLRGLFRARVVLARLLRPRLPVVPRAPRLRPDELPFASGGKVGFFTVAAAIEDRFLLLAAADSHLTGYLAFVAEPAAGGRRRFRLVTVVVYHRWTGPLYFNLIRPFHHLVVWRLARAGARQPLPA